MFYVTFKGLSSFLSYDEIYGPVFNGISKNLCSIDGPFLKCKTIEVANQCAQFLKDYHTYGGGIPSQYTPNINFMVTDESINKVLHTY